MRRKGYKLHSIIPIAALVLPIIGLGGWYGMTQWLDREPGVSAILQKAGYLELTPPSRLFGPGTISTVERLSNGSIQLHLACRMDNDALKPLWQVSDTVSESLAHNISHAFDALANMLTSAASHATGNRVKEIAISLEHMRILTMSHEDLLKIRSDYLKDTCEQAVLWNLKAGARVCQTEEVLEADLAYRMSFKDGLDISEEAELAKEVTGKLKLDADTTGV